MLTDTAIKNAKPKEKQYKISDAQGLYLLVSKTGKYWRYDYRFHSKRKTLALGVYPSITLKQARQEHQRARNQLAEGRDPSLERKLEKLSSKRQANDSFESIALEWMGKQKKVWSESHHKNVSNRLINNIFPWLGNRPIADITVPELLMVLRKMESRGVHYSTLKVKQYCGQIFRYAIVSGRAERDPSADLRGALTQPDKTKHFASITDPQKFGGLLRSIDEYEGEVVTCNALRLAPLVFVRPSELRHAEWQEINFDSAEWNIPAHKMKMKMKREHIVPLSHQSLSVFINMKPFTGNGKYVFPSIRSRERAMSENTINASLRRMGYTKEEMTGHGFRATASTMLNEQGFNSDWIETQLAHVEENKSRKPYNRANYLQQRKKMMQQWADYLDGLRVGTNVINLRSTQ